jgi:hypothetical protein
MPDFFQVPYRTRMYIIPIVTLSKIFQHFHPLQFAYSKPSSFLFLFRICSDPTIHRILFTPAPWPCTLATQLPRLYYLSEPWTAFPVQWRHDLSETRADSAIRHFELKPFCDITLASDQLVRQHSVSKCTLSITSDVLVVCCGATGLSTRLSTTSAWIFSWNRQMFEWPPSYFHISVEFIPSRALPLH